MNQDPKHVARLLASQEHVDKQFDASALYGPKGAAAVEVLAARSSHHPCPFSLGLQVGLLAATNGACVSIWPSALTPLSAIVLNVNLVQTRKSQVNGVLQKVSDVIQEACQKRASTIMTGQEAGHAGRTKMKLKSCTLTSFTEPALWERCAADFQQCASSQFSPF